MLGNNPFFFELLRKYQTYFAYIFSDITINRMTGNAITQIIKVPLQAASKNKQLVRVDSDPNLQKDVAITVPRMSYAYTDLVYNGDRKLPSMNMTFAANTSVSKLVSTQFTPVPYDITFKLYIYVNQIEDGTRILEQIVPFFTPDFTATIKLIPEMNEERDIPIVLDAIDIEDVYSGDMLTNRSIIYTMTFTMLAYLYAPIISKPLIKYAIENIKLDANGSVVEIFTTTPGLTANGQPTTLAANSVPVANVYITNNYGYILSANGLLRLANN